MRILALALSVSASLLVSPPALSDTGDPAVAADQAARTSAVIDGHILPGFTRLAQATEALKSATADSCGSPALRPAYDAAFDAWIGVSHLRFGPTETDDRAFAMAFWPDTKGFTKKALNRLIGKEDPVVSDPEGFAKLSIAGRGLFAMEQLLFDENMSQVGTPEYRCALVAAIAVDMDRNADAMLADWQVYGAQMLTPGEGTPYRSEASALQVLYQSLLNGLQFNADMRLGRPLGTFERPRPRRAEAWRSARSLRNVEVSLRALDDLSGLLSAGHDRITQKLGKDFDRLRDQTGTLGDPTFAGVSDPMSRIRIEAIQTTINATRLIVDSELGAALGVAEGFNALDGD